MKFDNRSYDFKTGYRLETGLPVSRLTSLVCLPPAVHPVVAIQQSTDTALVEIDVNKMNGLNCRYLPLPSDHVWSTKVDQPRSGPHWIHGLESVPRLVLALICSATSRCMTALVSHAVKAFTRLDMLTVQGASMPMSVKSHSAPQMRSRLLQQLLDMGFRVSHLPTTSI